MLSSAKLHASEIFIEKNKSLINILNKRGPKIDLCGTAVLISHEELNDESILVRCFLRVR